MFQIAQLHSGAKLFVSSKTTIELDPEMALTSAVTRENAILQI